MRENESDSGGGWLWPAEDASSWDKAGDGGYRDRAGDSGYGDKTGDGGYRDRASDSGYGDESGDGGYRDWPGYGSDPDRGGHGPGGYAGGGYGGPQWGLPAPPPPRRRRGRFLVYVAVAALAAGIGAGVTVAFGDHGTGSVAGISSPGIPLPHEVSPGSGSSSTLNQASVEAKVEPGLVDIISTLKYDSETAEGTGMVLSSTGLVLTNNHVIDGATTIKASLVGSGKPYPARVVGYDSLDDVALLQLAGASGLATVSFGNSSQVMVGTPVLALGNAEGRGFVTPAAGDIDALNRSIQASDAGSDTVENLNHMLQTDAPIQQGDSGGALANSAGQVIGMITAAKTPASGQPGATVGFAIPIDSALAIARQIAAGQASATVYIGLPGFLGVEVAQSDSPNPRQQAADERQSGDGPSGAPIPGGNGSACVLGGQEPRVPTAIAPVGTGALIVGVLCGTAADAQGLAPGDVITSVNGQAVTTPGSLTAITARYHPGDVVSVRWESVNGARHTASMTLGSGPAR